MTRSFPIIVEEEPEISYSIVDPLPDVKAPEVEEIPKARPALRPPPETEPVVPKEPVLQTTSGSSNMTVSKNQQTFGSFDLQEFVTTMGLTVPDKYKDLDLKNVDMTLAQEIIRELTSPSSFVATTEPVPVTTSVLEVQVPQISV